MENTEKPKSVNPAAAISYVLSVAMDEFLPGGAFPGGQILDFAQEDDTGDGKTAKLTCTLLLDKFGDREFPCTIEIRSAGV